MTPDDQKLEAFYDNVVGVVAGKYDYFHWPRNPCLDGSCDEEGVFHVGPIPPSTRCNWKRIFSLAAAFYRHGPDVSRFWKRTARSAGVDPSHFHEILLSIFLGCEGGYTGLRRSYANTALHPVSYSDYKTPYHKETS